MSQPPAHLSPYAVFRHRSFTRLWLAQFVSQFGSGLTLIAAGLLVYRQTGSALSVGLLLAVTVIPSLLLGLLAGAMVDRGDRRRMMIATDLVRAVLVGLIPLLTAHGTLWLYLLVMLGGAANQFFDPAFESALPETAPERELDSANTLMTVSTTAAQTLGFAAAGLISVVSLQWAFALDALSFLVSAALLWGVRLAPAAPNPAPARSVVGEVKAGLKIVRECAPLRSLFLLTAPILLLFGQFNALILPFAVHSLHAGPVVYGLFEGVPVIGNVVGGLLLVYVMGRLKAGQWITVSLIGMGALQVVAGSLHSVPGAVLCLMGVGLFNVPLTFARRSLVQREVEPQARGRVGSALFVVRDVFLVAGSVLAGLADLFDVRLLIVVGGTLLALIGLASTRMPGLSRPAARWQTVLVNAHRRQRQT